MDWQIWFLFPLLNYNVSGCVPLLLWGWKPPSEIGKKWILVGKGGFTFLFLFTATLEVSSGVRQCVGWGWLMKSKLTQPVEQKQSECKPWGWAVFPSDESAESSSLQPPDKGVCVAQCRKCKMLKIWSVWLGLCLKANQVQFSCVKFLHGCSNDRILS